jgi:tetratricopeptide (TPR) repeat protein
VRMLRLLAGLVGCAVSASAQFTPPPPSEKLLVATLTIKNPADSAMDIAVMDAARDRLGHLVGYKVLVVPKPKLCEALKASDYPCDVLLDDSQALQLARFLNVNAFTTGSFERVGGALTAHIRVRDIGSSGLAALFSVSSGNPATAGALGDAIAQRLNTLVKAAEQARECNDARGKSQFPKALDAARKALAIDPNLTAAHLCVATVYEAERMPPDSLIAANLRATKGDSVNGTAWDNIAHSYQQKGDTLKAIDAYAHELTGEPQNVGLRLGIAELLRQQRLYARAVTVLDEGLAKTPGEQKFLELKLRVCIEGEQWRCVLDLYADNIKSDTSLLGDTNFIRSALGAAQALSDTAQLLFYSHAAVKRYPRSAAFWKALGAAFDMKHAKDSSLWAYKQSLALDPNDMTSTLLVAKVIVDGAVWDTAQANRLKADTAALRPLRTALADQLDSAKVYLNRALASSDSSVRLNASVLLLSAGSKLAQAGAYSRAVPWLEQLLTVVAPRTPADTVGPRQQIRVAASFWYGVSSVGPLFAQYSVMVKSKNCSEAKAVNEWIGRAKDALILGTRIHPPTANAMLQNLARLEAIMPQVKKQFKCKSF